LEALKDELFYSQCLAVAEDDRVLVWTGDTDPVSPATARAAYTLGGRAADAIPLLTQAIAQSTATANVHFETLWSLSLGDASQPRSRSSTRPCRAVCGQQPPYAGKVPPREQRSRLPSVRSSVAFAAVTSMRCRCPQYWPQR
jgi:hypothetical protein